MKKIVITFLMIAVICSASSQENTKPLVIGETVKFYSDALKEDRKINVYLPHNYEADSLKTYPVIYVLDGSMDEDFIHIAGLVQFGSFSWISMVPESIVVGISNVDRRRDFTYPTTIEQDKKDFPTTGESENFINFIEKDLQPLVEKKYRTTETKTIIGQSLGGLLATEILYKKPNLFDNYIIVSPSLWWDNQSLLQLEAKEYKTNKNVYIAVGKEGEIMERDAKALYDRLNTNKKDNTKVHFQFLEAQDHGDALHLAVYGAFEALFSKK